MGCDCEDLRAVMSVLARIAMHNDLAEWDEYGALFTEDAVMHVFGRDYVGREAVVAFTARRHLGKHMLSTPVIDFDGDTAKVAVDHAFFRYPDLVLFGVGVYEDDLVKVDGQWKVARREITVHGHHAEMTAVSKQDLAPIADTIEERVVRLRDDDDEASVREVLRSFFSRAPRDVTRRSEALGHDDALWTELVAMGLPAIAVDVAAGGGGAGMPVLAVVAEELGRALAPAALLEHQLAASAVARHDPVAFADVITGQTVATLAVRPSVGGSWPSVPGAAVAGVAVGLDGDSLVAVRQDPPRATSPNLGSQALADVRVTHAATTRLGDAAAHVDLVDRWRVLTAASLVGLAESALQIGLDYVLERKQFGVAIGTYQSVQHGLADLPGLIAGARLLTGKAAWALEEPGPGVVDVGMNEVTGGRALASMAILFAAEMAEQVTDRALHFHGGYGVALETDIQLHYRRARAWPVALGPLYEERRWLASLLFSCSPEISSETATIRATAP